MDDSKSFWDKWKKLGENDTKNVCLDIPGKKLFDHFSNLHSMNQDEQEIKPDLFSKKIIDNERLNEPFSKKEFDTVINSLKNNKSRGLRWYIKRDDKTLP